MGESIYLTLWAFNLRFHSSASYFLNKTNISTDSMYKLYMSLSVGNNRLQSSNFFLYNKLYIYPKLERIYISSSKFNRQFSVYLFFLTLQTKVNFNTNDKLLKSIIKKAILLIFFFFNWYYLFIFYCSLNSSDIIIPSSILLSFLFLYHIKDTKEM